MNSLPYQKCSIWWRSMGRPSKISICMWYIRRSWKNDWTIQFFQWVLHKRPLIELLSNEQKRGNVNANVIENNWNKNWFKYSDHAGKEEYVFTIISEFSNSTPNKCFKQYHSLTFFNELFAISNKFECIAWLPSEYQINCHAVNYRNQYIKCKTIVEHRFCFER